jgi:transcriptional regulator with XRE-family HTH domain
VTRESREPVNPRDRFAIHLREARLTAGLTQDELADRCYLHRTEVSLLERAGREPRLGTLIKLSSALGVTPESLCAGISWDEKRQRFRFSKR